MPKAPEGSNQTTTHNRERESDHEVVFTPQTTLYSYKLPDVEHDYWEHNPLERGWTIPKNSQVGLSAIRLTTRHQELVEFRATSNITTHHDGVELEIRAGDTFFAHPRNARRLNYSQSSSLNR